MCASHALASWPSTPTCLPTYLNKYGNRDALAIPPWRTYITQPYLGAASLCKHNHDLTSRSSRRFRRSNTPTDTTPTTAGSITAGGVGGPRGWGQGEAAARCGRRHAGSEQERRPPLQERRPLVRLGENAARRQGHEIYIWQGASPPQRWRASFSGSRNAVRFRALPARLVITRTVFFGLPELSLSRNALTPPRAR